MRFSRSPVASDLAQKGNHMANTVDFYLTQVNACTAEAERSTLTNVRERNLRAAAAWQEMADKLLAVEKSRAEKQAIDALRAAAVTP